MISIKVWFCAVVCGLLFANASAHTYKSGECPSVEPMSGFDMKKFLGIWYAIQKTGTASECVIYNITQDEPGMYKIQQISQNFLLGLIKHKYSYTGELETKDNDVPAKMRVNFPLSVAGSASFNVFMTDYQQFAGIFTCQKLPVGHRHSATILSRTKDLERAYVDKVRTRLAGYQVDPFDLSIISQSNCPKLNEENGQNVEIDPDTFSAQNIGGWFRKAGDKIGEGVSWTVDKTKMVYHKIRNDSGDDSGERSSRLTQGESSWFP
ncbi:unnamed protein product [Diamesa tonsa]